MPWRAHHDALDLVQQHRSRSHAVDPHEPAPGSGLVEVAQPEEDAGEHLARRSKEPQLLAGDDEREQTDARLTVERTDPGHLERRVIVAFAGARLVCDRTNQLRTDEVEAGPGRLAQLERACEAETQAAQLEEAEPEEDAGDERSARSAQHERLARGRRAQQPTD